MGKPSPARFAAPFAFLAAVTVAVVLIRSGLDGRTSGGSRPATVLQTRSTTTAPEPVTVAPTTAPATTTAAATTTAPDTTETYTIKSGDTLDKIALQFGSTVEQLLVLNPDVDPVSLQVGQTIRVK